MPAEDRAISDFPIALQLLNTALVLISNPDGQGGYDSYQATLTELGRVILETQYTQDLGNVDVFDAIKNCRTLSGTTTPTSQEGADGQLYVKYTTSGNDTSVTGLYVKLSGSWCEISTGGGGDVGIECTQAQYDAWEQAGTLLQDTNYYITDGQSGGGVVIDDTTASLTTVYSSSKVADEISRIDTGKQNTLIIEDISSGITFTSLENMTGITVVSAYKYGKIVDIFLQPEFSGASAGISHRCYINFTDNNNRPKSIATTSMFQGTVFFNANLESNGIITIRDFGSSGSLSPYMRFIYLCN